jgi:hypothetical protein
VAGGGCDLREERVHHRGTEGREIRQREMQDGKMADEINSKIIFLTLIKYYVYNIHKKFCFSLRFFSLCPLCLCGEPFLLLQNKPAEVLVLRQ